MPNGLVKGVSMNLHILTHKLKNILQSKRYIGYIISNYPFIKDFYEDGVKIKNHVLTVDAVSPFILKKDYRRGGRTSVFIGINDIIAMGCIPQYFMSILAGSKENVNLMAKGINDAIEQTGVKIIGGHTSIQKHPFCGIAMIGQAYNRILTSCDAKPDDDIIFAVDMDGYPSKIYRYSFISWDKNKKELWRRWSPIVSLTQMGYLNSGKDISMGGTIGTISMICEASEKGAIINLNSIPKPEYISLSRWLCMFQSIGFIFTSNNTQFVLEILEKSGYTAKIIGKILKRKTIILQYNQEKIKFLDFDKESIYYENAQKRNEHQIK